jgi:hypothetical protein
VHTGRVVGWMGRLCPVLAGVEPGIVFLFHLLALALGLATVVFVLFRRMTFVALAVAALVFVLVRWRRALRTAAAAAMTAFLFSALSAAVSRPRQTGRVEPPRARRHGVPAIGGRELGKAPGHDCEGVQLLVQELRGCGDGDADRECAHDVPPICDGGRHDDGLRYSTR